MDTQNLTAARKAAIAFEHFPMDTEARALFAVIRDYLETLPAEYVLNEIVIAELRAQVAVLRIQIPTPATHLNLGVRA